MISKAVTFHFCLMLSLCLAHLIIVVTCSINLLQTINTIKDSAVCTSVHISNHGLYLLANFIAMIFFFDMARNSRVHSTDVLIFTTKRKYVRFGLITPFLLAVGYLVANLVCEKFKFPRLDTMIYCSHLGLELYLVQMYLGWFQTQLINLTDATELGNLGSGGDAKGKVDKDTTFSQPAQSS